MSSHRTNTTQSLTTGTNLDKFQFEEANYRESSFDDHELTYEEFSGLQASNTISGDKNEKSSTIFNEDIIGKKSDVNMSSDSEIDFGLTLDQALKTVDAQAITESYMKVQYYLHSMKEKKMEKFIENEFEAEALIDKKRLEEKFAYLNPNYSEKAFNTSQQMRIRTAGRGILSPQTAQRASRISSQKNLPTGSRKRFISQEDNLSKYNAKPFEQKTTLFNSGTILDEVINLTDSVANLKLNEDLILKNDDSKDTNDAFEDAKESEDSQELIEKKEASDIKEETNSLEKSVKPESNNLSRESIISLSNNDASISQNLNLTKDNNIFNNSNSSWTSVKNPNSTQGLNMGDQLNLKTEGRSRSLSSNKSKSSSSKSFYSKKVMFEDTLKIVDNFKNMCDLNQKVDDLDSNKPSHVSNTTKGSSIHKDSHNSLIKNTTTDLNNNHVNNLSNTSTMSSQNTKSSENYFFLPKTASKRICEHCIVYYSIQENF